MKLVTVPVADLVPDPLNARRHDDENVEAIMRSLAQFGQAEPLVRNSRTGHLIGGHGRLDAMKRLGWADAQVVDLDLDESKARALGIALNQTATLAEWDEARLASLLHDFDADDRAATGFDADEVEDLIRDYWSEDGPGTGPTAGLTDPDEVPEVPVDPVTKPGDLIVLGRHRLLCGDATKADDVARLLGDVVPFLMVTDPPYGVEYDPEWRQGLGWSPTKATGKVPGDDRADWTEAWLLFPGDVGYIWHGGLHAVTVMESLRKSGLLQRAQIIWAKQMAPITRGAYRWQHEPCWYVVRDGATAQWTGDHSQTTLWEISNLNTVGGKSKDADDVSSGHGTQKPIECMERPIRNHGKPGMAVYDPFLGSGTTMIACERTGRRCFGLELSPAYCDVIVGRWERFTGEKAVRNPCAAA